MLETVTPSIPKIGEAAPDFKAQTTQAEEMTFSEWQGKDWCVLFSHPADFTPVCSTELMEFARKFDDFAKINTKLIGISVDSVHSHLAWLQNMREKMGVEIPFPMIADISMQVSNRFGMIHPGASATATVRAVFVIDPRRTIRALVYYPMNVGRNVDEILRLVTALQTADRHTVATPVNWVPGDKVVVPPPKKTADVKERESHKGKDYEYKDFYLCLKDLETALV